MKPVSIGRKIVLLDEKLAGPVYPELPLEVDSRIADKFALRGFDELFDELSLLGRYQARSKNSEAVLAILEALDGWRRTTALLDALVWTLGDDTASLVLASVEEFDLSSCYSPHKFVIRFPPTVRDRVKAIVDDRAHDANSMNDWFLEVMMRWVNVQRKYYALLSATLR